MKEKIIIRLVDLFHLFKAEYFRPACSKSLSEPSILQEKRWNDYLEIKCAKYLISLSRFGIWLVEQTLGSFFGFWSITERQTIILVWPTKVETHWLVCSRVFAASWATLWLCSPLIWQFACKICMSQFEALDLNCQFRWCCLGFGFFLQIQRNIGCIILCQKFARKKYFPHCWFSISTFAKSANITLWHKIFQSRRVFPIFRTADKLSRWLCGPDVTSSPTRVDINIIKRQAHYLCLFDKRDAN